MKMVYKSVADMKEAVTQERAKAEVGCRREFGTAFSNGTELYLIGEDGERVGSGEPEPFNGTAKQLTKLMARPGVVRIQVGGTFDATIDGEREYIDCWDWALVLAYEVAHVMTGDLVNVYDRSAWRRDGETSGFQVVGFVGGRVKVHRLVDQEEFLVDRDAIRLTNEFDPERRADYLRVWGPSVTAGS